MVTSPWRLLLLSFCLCGSLSADGGVLTRLRGGTYLGQSVIQYYMLFDAIWEWTQVEADIDRLEATTVDELRKPLSLTLAEQGGSALRNLVKLWIAYRASLGITNDEKGTEGKTRELTAVTGVLLGLGVGANATHAWFRRTATHMSELDEQLFAAYNRRLTPAQKDRRALVQKKLRRESMPFKLALRLVPTRNNVWQFKADKEFEKSSKILGCLLLDSLFTMRLRKRRADYIDTVLQEAHAQYDPVKAQLDETARALADREFELAQQEAAHANGVDADAQVAILKNAVTVLYARHKELTRYEQLLRGVVPGNEGDESLSVRLNNDQVSRELAVLV